MNYDQRLKSEIEETIAGLRRTTAEVLAGGPEACRDYLKRLGLLDETESSPSYTRAEVAEILEWVGGSSYIQMAHDPSIWFYHHNPMEAKSTSDLITEYENRPENKDKTV